jgi:hypothetical protein
MDRPLKHALTQKGDVEFSGKPIYGVFISANGEKYIGEFLNDNFHGRGVIYDQFGNILLKGFWQHGEYMGKY